MRYPTFILLITVFLIAAFSLKAQEKNENNKKPAHITVTTEPLRVDITLEGVFESQNMTPIVLKPEVWKEFQILSVVAAGTEVRKGETLIQFDTEKIDRKIEKLVDQLKLMELSIKKEEHELNRLKASKEKDLSAAQVAYERAKENRDIYLKKTKPLEEKRASQRLKNSEFHLEMTENQLKHLEQMYKEDEMVGASEEIVMKRHRNRVDNAELGLELAKKDHWKKIDIDIPREEEDILEEFRQAEITHQKKQFDLEHQVTAKQLELLKKKTKYKESKETLGFLKKDRELMTIKAPREGLLYYGPCQFGKWPRMFELTSQLQVNNILSLHKISQLHLFTLVDPSELIVKTFVPEKYLRDLRDGLEGYAIPTRDQDERIPAKLHRIQSIALKPGYFVGEAQLSPKQELPLPGYNCQLRFVSYHKGDAILLAKNLVHSDGENPDEHYVWLKEGENTKKVSVTLGRRQQEKVEILSGLKIGDQVLFEKP